MCKSLKTAHSHDKHRAVVDDYSNRILKSIVAKIDEQSRHHFDQQEMMLSLTVVYLQLQHQNQFVEVVQRHPKLS